MGGGYLHSSLQAKRRWLWIAATSIAGRLRTKSEAVRLENLVGQPLFHLTTTLLLLGISIGTAFSYAPSNQKTTVTSEAQQDLAAEASPRLGGETLGWRKVWTPPPTAIAVARLSPSSTPAPAGTTGVSGEERPALSARSSDREEASAESPIQTPQKPLTFEERFVAGVAQAAQASQQETGVPASVTIAQAMLESDWGRSGLSLNANNFFGIKARGKEGSAGVVWMNTWEVVGGKNVTVSEPFRAYKSMSDSFFDHGKFFTDNDRYAAAMKAAGDALAFAREIHQAGYATDPAYSDKLIALMSRFNLRQYDSK